MTIAKTADEAMDLLKSSVSDPVPEVTEQEVVETKEIDIDMVKAEEVEMLAEKLKDSDEFFIGLAEHQATNIDKLVKGLEGNMNATHAVLGLFKGFTEKLETLTDIVGKLVDAPQPRKSALSKSEAIDVAKGVVGNNEEASAPLRKAEIVTALNKAYMDGKCDPNDVVKAETGLGGGNSVDEIPLEVIFRQLSEGGQTVVKELIESRS